MSFRYELDVYDVGPRLVRELVGTFNLKTGSSSTAREWHDRLEAALSKIRGTFEVEMFEVNEHRQLKRPDEYDLRGDPIDRQRVLADYGKQV